MKNTWLIALLLGIFFSGAAVSQEGKRDHKAPIPGLLIAPKEGKKINISVTEDSYRIEMEGKRVCFLLINTAAKELVLRVVTHSPKGVADKVGRVEEEKISLPRAPGAGVCTHVQVDIAFEEEGGWIEILPRKIEVDT